MDQEIRFKFRVSAFGEAEYEIVRWRHPDHGKRVCYRWMADPYDPKFHNYTPERYAQMVVARVGYMWWATGSAREPVPLEYVRAMNAQILGETARSREKYPEYTEEPKLLKGTCYFVWNEPGPPPNYDAGAHWVFQDLEE